MVCSPLNRPGRQAPSMTRKPSRAATLRTEAVEPLQAGGRVRGEAREGLEVDLRDSLAMRHSPAPHIVAGKGTQWQQGQDEPPCPPDLQLVVPHVGGGWGGCKAQVRQRGVGSQLALEGLVRRGVAARMGMQAEIIVGRPAGEHRHMKASSNRGMLEANYQGSTRHTALLTRRPQRRRWRQTGWRGCCSSPAPPPVPPAKVRRPAGPMAPRRSGSCFLKYASDSTGVSAQSTVGCPAQLTCHWRPAGVSHPSHAHLSAVPLLLQLAAARLIRCICLPQLLFSRIQLVALQPQALQRGVVRPARVCEAA